MALRAEFPGHVGCVDFIHDACLNGPKLKILSVVDEFTRECLALEVGTRLNARRVREVLAPLMASHGAPRLLRSDIGPEFLARLLAVLLSESGSGSHFVRPGFILAKRLCRVVPRNVSPGTSWGRGHC